MFSGLRIWGISGVSGDLGVLRGFRAWGVEGFIRDLQGFDTCGSVPSEKTRGLPSE